jgi:hypothetical protein
MTALPILATPALPLTLSNIQSFLARSFMDKVGVPIMPFAFVLLSDSS